MMFVFKIDKSKLLLIIILSLVQVNCCYWNDPYPYQLFGSKTPYETVRGDIRDYNTPENCEAVSIWNINRHGNRNPGPGTIYMKKAAMLRDEIIAAYKTGSSQLCAQDIEDLSNWVWNNKLESSSYNLSDVGYEELFGIGKRIGEKFHYLFKGDSDQYHFRSTGQERSIVSRVAFIHGLTSGIKFNVTVEIPWKRDDVIAPYHTCLRYRKTIRTGKVVKDKGDGYVKSIEFIAVKKAVQKRLGIGTQLTIKQMVSIYNLCRYYRSWSPNLKSPWCAAFSNEDLMVLEYYDDLTHYYRNGYGSWVNVNLGKTTLKNLYESFEAAVNGTGKKLISYFTHETLTEMMTSAMGHYSGDVPLQPNVRNPKRVWRSSYLAPFAVNIIVVLYRCNEAGNQTYRVQFLYNEKEITICSSKGCSWQEFQNKFRVFTDVNLDFCSLNHTNEAINVAPQAYDTGSKKLWRLISIS